MRTIRTLYNSGNFYCLNPQSAVIREGRRPNEKSAGVKDSGVVLFILLILLSHTSVYAEQNVIDYLVPLIIQAESSGNPNASDGYSYGLMGISPSVLRDYNDDTYKHYITCYEDGFLAQPIAYTKKDLFDEKINKQVGIWYLHEIQSWLPDQYKNSKPHIIYAYNSGIGKLRKDNWNIPSWTKNHPNRIYRKIYRGEL